MQSPGGPYSAIGAVRYGWRAMVANTGLSVGAAAVALAVVFVVLIGVVAVGMLVWSAGSDVVMDPAGLDPADVETGPTWLFSIILQVVTIVATVPLVRAGLAITAGRRVAFGDLFATHRLGQAAIVGLILGLVSGIAASVPVIGSLIGLAVTFLAQYVLFFTLDGEQDAIEALVASARFAIDHPGPVILLIMLSIPVTLAGFLVCVVGVVFSMAIMTIAQAYTYRVLRDEPVAIV